MPNINLIQEQRSASRSGEVRARAGFFAFAGITVISLGMYGMLFVQSGELSSREARLRGELLQLEPAVKQIEQNRKVESELKPRLETLEEAQQLTDKWVAIVTHFTRQTPDRTWLTSLKASGNDEQKPVGITLAGMAMAQEPVGEFMLRTQNEPNLEAVTLKYTSERISPYGPTVEFEISAEVKGTAPEKKLTEEVEGEEK